MILLGFDAYEKPLYPGDRVRALTEQLHEYTSRTEFTLTNKRIYSYGCSFLQFVEKDDTGQNLYCRTDMMVKITPDRNSISDMTFSELMDSLNSEKPLQGVRP